VIERLTDDLDGGDAAETVMFGLDRKSYEIDLSKRNAAAMRKGVQAVRRRGSPELGRDAASVSPAEPRTAGEAVRSEASGVAETGL
jgi:hypothetical protein